MTDDGRLDQGVTVGADVSEWTVGRLFHEAGAQTGIGLVASSQLLNRGVRPSQRPLTSRAALKLAEEFTGGVVRPVGDAYALEPNCIIERAARCPKDFRVHIAPKHPQTEFQQFQVLLDRSTQESLDRGEALNLRRLTTVQREVLEKAVAVSFALHEGIARRALALDGVRVTVSPTDGERSLPRRFVYELPARGSGTAPVIVEVEAVAVRR